MGVLLLSQLLSGTEPLLAVPAKWRRRGSMCKIYGFGEVHSPLEEAWRRKAFNTCVGSSVWTLDKVSSLLHSGQEEHELQGLLHGHLPHGSWREGAFSPSLPFPWGILVLSILLLAPHSGWDVGWRGGDSHRLPLATPDRAAAYRSGRHQHGEICDASCSHRSRLGLQRVAI